MFIIEIFETERESEIQKILIEWKQFKELMKDSELKKNMVLHRTQEKLHGWINPKVGDKVILPEYRSTAISKEGVETYKNVYKQKWWDLIIMAPQGTKGTYIAPKALSKKHKNKYIREMEVILGPDTPMEIEKIDFVKKKITLKVITR